MTAKFEIEERYPIKVGDKVVVLSHRNVDEGVIDKIGTKIVYIRTHGWRLTPYWRDRRNLRSGYSGSFRTQQEHEDIEGAIAVTNGLSIAGITLDRTMALWTQERRKALLEYVRTLLGDGS